MPATSGGRRASWGTSTGAAKSGAALWLRPTESTGTSKDLGGDRVPPQPHCTHVTEETEADDRECAPHLHTHIS